MNNIQIIKGKIEKCIQEFYLNDLDLLERENYEVTISCKLSQYLKEEFPKFDVDCEYDRQGEDGERKDTPIEGKLKEIRPDIVIHRRGRGKDNLVYIEIKTDHYKSKKAKDDDFKKIKSMTSESKKHKYFLGIFINFNRDKEHGIKYFQDGREIHP